jgi:D-2-hydroxyacid dehydrogenase (NADP+)
VDQLADYGCGSVMSKMKVLVSFDLPSIYAERIRRVSPKLEVVQSEDKEEALRLIRDADVLFAGFFSKELLLAATRLKWIQAWEAGVDRFVIPELANSQVLLTNAGGVHPTPVSEHVFSMMLCFCRKMHFFIRNQMESKWERAESWESTEQIEELSGKTIGVVGLGKIGTEIAAKAKCLGMRVIATKRDPSRSPPVGVDKIINPRDLSQLLTEADFVVLSLPLTKGTEGMIGETELKSMKKTAYLINVSRGKIVQEHQLIKALKQEWIRGAGLDTFEKEPLPESSELWKLKNVIITPHVAGMTPHYLERLTDLFCENLERFLNGQPLINVVDKTLGY